VPSRVLDALSHGAVAALYDASGARQWDLAFEAFGEALERSARHRFGDAAPSAALKPYLEGLHLQDLALAAACAAGSEPAWDAFVARYREPLRRAARAIARTEAADDLADGLLADLFGLVEREGARRSLFLYFHGRSALGTWLRAVLAQRHVDALRTRRVEVPLANDGAGDAGAGATMLLAAASAPPPDPDRARLAAWLTAAVREAVDALDPKDRLRLSLYYRGTLNLAAIGRMLDEHESTVSRQLDRCRRRIREDVERTLARQHRLGPAEVHQAFEAALDDPRLALDTLLGAPSPYAHEAPAATPPAPPLPRKNAAADRSTHEDRGTTS
jgi:RNA polymerase sigma-70 factor (ECF subfamily)